MITVLFENHHLYYLPHFEPIITKLLKRGDYEVAGSIPLTVAADERRFFAEAIQKLGVEHITAPDEETRVKSLQQREFDVIIVGNVGRLETIAAENSVVVMVYHGIGLKQSYYVDMSPRVDLRAVESEARYEELESRGESNLVLTGLTKLDSLIGNQETLRKKLMSKWFLDPSRSTVLYAPSFYPSSLEKLLPELPALAKHVNVLVKLHNFSWHQRRYKFQSQLALDIITKHEGIKLLPPEEFDITPYFSIADILLSDISSTLFEFLAVNRPIVQTYFYALKTRHNIFRWRLSRRLDLERAEKIDFTHSLHRPIDLVPVITEILENPSALANLRKSAARKHLYKIDGQASSRLINAIEKLLKEKKNS